uniref:Reverse transcriptase domain-containing protein n=1 Tax=Amphimedon queenslandica TaxID=400682 RepID=A0A1X7U2L5_AMPQE
MLTARSQSKVPADKCYASPHKKSLPIHLPAVWLVLHSFGLTMKPSLTLLRELGVRLVAYIKDILVLAEAWEMARDHTEGLKYLFENLRFIIDPDWKVATTTKETELSGMVVDS